MMLALAQFIMRGRLQAAVPALFSMTIPLLPLGAIGLVTLRKGPREGALLILIALVPALISWSMGKPGTVVFWGTLLGLLAVYIPAICLRATMSWAFAIQAAVVTSIVSVFFAVNFVPALMDAFIQLTAMFLAVIEGRSPNEDLSEPSVIAVSGFIGLVMLFNGLTGLILARWWQSSLYNAGGFGSEFRELRLGVLTSSVCAVLVALCYFQGVEYSFWATVFAGPLIMVAIAIVHDLAKSQKLNKAWLVVFYMLIIGFSSFLLVLAVMGFIDTWVNIRSRFSTVNKS